MHEFVGPDNRIDRASLYAQGAADAVRFVDDRYLQRQMLAAMGIQEHFGQAKQRGQGLDASLAAGRAAVDGCVIQGNSLGIWPAAIVAALGALGLGKNRIDAVGKLR
jgi:hypothetical protein